jgi:ABC-2 type transport system ATP-binding protein
MKMELIGALLHWPKVIFLDEPTIGLDVLAAHKLREFLREFNAREKATIILTSHNMEDIERLCSRVMILKTGKLLYDGKPQGLTQSGERQLKITLLETPQVADVAALTGLAPEQISLKGEEDSEEESTTHHLWLTIKNDQIAPTLQKLLGRYTISDMGIQGQSLERVIQKIYESESASGVRT